MKILEKNGLQNCFENLDNYNFVIDIVICLLVYDERNSGEITGTWFSFF